MKANFVISALRDIWLTGSKKLFATDPYIVHVLNREGWNHCYENIEVAEMSRESRGEFEADHDYIDRKYRKYNAIIIERLTKLHGPHYGERFWNKALSLSILRHATQCFEVFKVCESNLNPERHNCQILDNKNFYVPSNFDDHRHFFQNTDYGREQLFSRYCQIFYPDKFKYWSGYDYQSNDGQNASTPSFATVINYIKFKKRVRNFLRLLKSKIKKYCKISEIDPATLAIMDCSFSERYIQRLTQQGAGKITVVNLPTQDIGDSRPDWRTREKLCEIDQSFDNFDKYVFSCLEFGLPKMYVEDFERKVNELTSFFKQYPFLRWVVCEWWIGHSLSSFAVAVLSLSGVKHISVEHNYLSHCLLGSNVKYLPSLADEYFTLGWSDGGFTNTHKGASLYPWVDDVKSTLKEHDILFMLTAPIAYMPEISAAYSGNDGARGVLGYFDWTKKFLSEFNKADLARMYIRAYPLQLTHQWLTWDTAYELTAFRESVKFYDDNGLTSSRNLMNKSRLVVINYTATSYLESMMANVPTVFFWCESAKPLSKEYLNFFDDLVRVGICQTDPIKAANFVKEIYRSPNEWWFSKDVQESRNNFLNANFGDPEFMVQYLLAKSTSDNSHQSI